MTPQQKRARAAQACIDRFFGKSYEPGKRDCAQMVKHLLHHLGRRVGQGKVKPYSSDAGGRAVLKGMGHKTLIEALDGFGLPRIPPARAVVGDIIALPTDHPLGALAVVVGNGRALAFMDGHDGAVILEPTAFVAAWRTL